MVSNLPKVSVIIPVYNGSNYLSDSINSALAQDYPNIEVLVINDGSTDEGKSEGVALSFGSRIKYFSKPNGGVSSALNLGIENMSGDYFSWLSHDDLFDPHRISRLIGSLSASEQEVVISNNWELVDDHLQHIRFVTNFDPYVDALPYAFLLGCLTNGCSLLVPRSLFEKVGRFDENLRCVQDLDMFIRLSKVARFKHIPEVLTKIRVHRDQVTVLRSEKLLKEEEALQKQYFLEIVSSNNIELARKSFPYKPNNDFEFLLWLYCYYREVRYLKNTSSCVLSIAKQRMGQFSSAKRTLKIWKIALVENSKLARHSILWRFYANKLLKARDNKDLISTLVLYFQIRRRMTALK